MRKVYFALIILFVIAVLLIVGRWVSSMNSTPL